MEVSDFVLPLEVRANDEAGTDGVKIWDAKTRKPINIPKQPYNERAQVSCVCWITRHNEAVDTLCYGNALGFLVFLQYCPAEVSEIECLEDVY